MGSPPRCSLGWLTSDELQVCSPPDQSLVLDELWQCTKRTHRMRGYMSRAHRRPSNPGFAMLAAPLSLVFDEESPLLGTVLVAL